MMIRRATSLLIFNRASRTGARIGDARLCDSPSLTETMPSLVARKPLRLRIGRNVE